MRIGAITYSRNRVSATYADWPSNRPLHVTEIGTAIESYLGRLRDERAILTQAFQNPKIEDGKQMLEEISRALIKTAGQLDKIVISGHGPFVASEHGQRGQSTMYQTSSLADRPFKSLDLRGAVCSGTKLTESNIHVITDVAAMAVAGYWTTWIDQREHAFKTPNVVAAFIAEYGIGGAVAQEGGEIMGQAHHAEMGHIPAEPSVVSGTLEPDPIDRLRESDCKCGRKCLTWRAGTKALEHRAKLVGLTLDDLYKDEDHPIWYHQVSYLSQLCLSVVLMMAPTKILIGGTLIEKAPFLVERIHPRLMSMLRGYVYYSALDNDSDSKFIEGVDRMTSMMIGALLHGVSPKDRIDGKSMHGDLR